MPVSRKYLMPNGTKSTIVDAEYERRYREHLMKTAWAPEWHNDLTYNMRKKR